MTRSGNILQAHYCSTTTACGSSYQSGNWMSQYGSRDQANAGQAGTGKDGAANGEGSAPCKLAGEHEDEPVETNGQSRDTDRPG